MALLEAGQDLGVHRSRVAAEHESGVDAERAVRADVDLREGAELPIDDVEEERLPCGTLIVRPRPAFEPIGHIAPRSPEDSPAPPSSGRRTSCPWAERG